MAFAKKSSVVRVDLDNIAVLGITFNLCYSTGENPGMKSLKTLVLAFFQDYFSVYLFSTL